MVSILFISLPDQRPFVNNMCIATHIETVHELTLLPINSASEIFSHESGGIFITGVPPWRWLYEQVTKDKKFYSLLFEQEIVAAPVTATFSSFSHSSRQPLLDIQYRRTHLIRRLVIGIANFPDRLGPSGKFVDNSTKLNCLEITGYAIKYRTLLWLINFK